MASLIGFQCLPALAGSEVRPHLTAIGRFVEYIQDDPARGGICRAGKFTTGKLDFRQPVEDQTQATAPDFTLDSCPIVETRCIAQRKTGEKIATYTGSGGL